MKEVRDGFIWFVVSQEQAEKIFINEIFDIYKLYSDGSEALIEDLYEIKDAFDKGFKVAIEIGFL